MAFPPDSQGGGSTPTPSNAQQMGSPVAPNPQSTAPGGRSIYGSMRPMGQPAKPFNLAGDDNSVTNQGTAGTISTDEAEGVGSLPLSPDGGTPNPMSGI